jgi:Tol biopolymer transport system component
MLSECSRRLAPSLAVIVLVAACAGNEPKAEEAGAEDTQHESTGSVGTGRIVFDANWDVYVVAVDGSGLKRLTTSPAREYDPSWSPDGTKIAYRYQPDEDEAEAEIYVMNADGSGKRNLTESGGQDHSPAWSPDGTKIAFASTRGQDNLLPTIWVMNADGSNPRRVTSISGEYPAWSRDGTRIAFDVNTDIEPNAGGGPPADFDIFVVNADGSGLQRLTNALGEDQGPSWSPDGKEIVFHSDRGRSDGVSTLWLMDADGSEQRRLTAQGGFRPAWSRDGSHILFGANGLFTVRPDGSGLTKLPVHVPGELGFADWTQ